MLLLVPWFMDCSDVLREGLCMSDQLGFQCSLRDMRGKGAARALRRAGHVPGVIYGGGKEPESVYLQMNELQKIMSRGRFMSTLFTVNTGDEDTKVVVRAVQKHPLNCLPTHIDLMRIVSTSRITLHVPVEFINKSLSPGLKSGGVLNIVRHDVEVSVIAGMIPDHITVDLTGANFGDVIRFSSIELADGIYPVIRGRDFTIATIVAPTVSVAMGDETNEGKAE